MSSTYPENGVISSRRLPQNNSTMEPAIETSSDIFMRNVPSSSTQGSIHSTPTPSMPPQELPQPIPTASMPSQDQPHHTSLGLSGALIPQQASTDRNRAPNVSQETTAAPEPSLPPIPIPIPMLGPGSCALRLANLESQPPQIKSELMRSIAEDISATFILVSRHVAAGTLEHRQTDILDNVIRTIRDTDLGRRKLLERETRRLRKERNWLRKRHSTVAGEMDALATGYNKKMQELRNLLRETRGEVVRLQKERELLLNCVQMKGVDLSKGHGKEDGVDAEEASAKLGD